MTISAYSGTAGSNATINGINIAEGCPPGNINDAIRNLMADIVTELLQKAGGTMTGGLGVGAGPTTGDITNVLPVAAGRFYTLTGTASISAGVATTVGTIPASTNGTYIVTCSVGAAPPADYTAVALVSMSNNTLRQTNLQTATALTISISGANVQVLQTSGSTQTVAATFTRIA